jgi:16S rRNA (uracil1498-N3)-methyltransferase
VEKNKIVKTESRRYSSRMRLHRFFITDHLRNKKELSIFDDELIHQWKDVFRLKVGNKIILLDNTGFEYLSEIEMLSKGKVDVKIIEGNICENIPKKDIWLFAALIKKDNYEWIIGKGTEIGVSHFVPIVSDRSEKKNLNMERAQKIMKEASEQSARGKLPELHEIVDVETALENPMPKLIAFDVGGMPFDVANFKSPSTSFPRQGSEQVGPTSIGILVGPEGGWSDRELELFKQKNIPMYSLGSQILRAETAAIVIPSLFLF